ncbi:hypothetical protein SAMN05444003_0198 [Cognatiyoonia sediminum]|uniref:Uncharacterized protein n=1 Tax=Cognatiyoonia sediminum TaxID=1508389 RepID=A0A1M5LB13_9RHOB|nr:hypothetical protein [Cognatiyoonia sediminum]SHG62207.1 hypothetical protein SAMN05444003_0198 [Cognatiyoonia sediminum]
MYEYQVIAAPNGRNSFGLRKNAARQMQELNDLLNSMSTDHWEYMGDREDGRQMVFARVVQSLENGYPPKVRPVRQASMDKPIVVRRVRPKGIEINPEPAFKSKQPAAANTQAEIDPPKVVALGSKS